MKEINSLIGKAEKFLKSAKLLYENRDYESCISRIYYAMFYSVQAVLLTKNMSFSSHKGVLSSFGKHFVKTGVLSKDMSRQLNMASEKRQLGDYSHTFYFDDEEAKELLAIGVSFVDNLIQHLKKVGQL
jgi:uncharacterized protein (UPF0332 family)